MKQNSRGFTLIEMLVVLVITSMATSLLIAGLNTTWRNFGKLLSKDLVSQSARLPSKWFADSIRGAMLFHPEKSYFWGDSNSIQFYSMASPSRTANTPMFLSWKIRAQTSTYELAFSETNIDFVEITSFNSEPRFQYLYKGKWQDSFDMPGRLPDAVMLMQGGELWAFAVPGRPVDADVPQEMPMTGEYEF